MDAPKLRPTRSARAALLLTLPLLACGGDGGGSGITDDGGGEGLPAFMRQGWIWQIAPNSVRTYDFTQAQAAGRRTVEIRLWTRIGTLAWQPNQIFTAEYTVQGNRFFLRGATGHREDWEIVRLEGTRLLLRDLQIEATYQWFSCAETAAWPNLVWSSNRACTGR